MLKWNDERGFTLVELLMVMVILGILAYVAIVRMNPQETRIAAAAKRAASGIRYAQELAMATHRVHGITFRFRENSYRVYRTTVDTLVAHPVTQDSFVVVFGGGVWIDADFTVEFDDLGAPDTSGVVTLNGARKTIFVTPNTGRVTIQ